MNVKFINGNQGNIIVKIFGGKIGHQIDELYCNYDKLLRGQILIYFDFPLKISVQLLIAIKTRELD